MENKFPPASANSILAALPVPDFRRLRPHFEEIEIPAKTVIHRHDAPITHVYFITRGIASVVAYDGGGLGTEVAIIGREGMTGLPVVLGADSTPYECVIQVPGTALRMKTSAIRTEFAAGGQMQRQILQHTYRLLVQISQAVLCNRLHTIEKRLSKWLLACHDRSDPDVLDLTQEFLAIILGSTRTSVGLSAIELQRSGLISYHRGKITIRDRAGLEAFACECYKVIHDAYSPVLAKKSLPVPNTRQTESAAPSKLQ
jgi:CRP-like cAMP-binding protein